GAAAVAVVVAVHAAARGRHGVGQELCSGRVIGRDSVAGVGDIVHGHDAGAAEVEHGDGTGVALNVADIVVVEVERAAAPGVKGAQIDVFHFHTVTFQAVERSVGLVGDDAVARVDILAAPHHAADQRRVVAVQREAVNGDVIGLDQDDAAGARAERTAPAAA